MEKQQWIKDWVNKHQKELYDYLSIPTVSAQATGIDETVTYVETMFKNRKATVKVLNDCGGNPVIYAFFKGESDRTLLFYNHYDVQPPEPLDEWHSEPFEPTCIDDILYCRGVADNKGNLVSRLMAIDYYQEVVGSLPCNIKFLVEGEEEIGSPNLESYLKKYGDLFKADGCIWEFGGKAEDESFVIDCGVKGLLYMEASVKTADIDAHSSLGALIDNAAWRLVAGLSTLKDVKGKILIDGFYDHIVKPSDDEIAAAKSIDTSFTAYQETLGITRPFINDEYYPEPSLAYVFSPTVTINGLLSGYVGKGSKTVLPKQAMAKIESRLVPGQDPEYIFECYRKHLDKHGFEDIQLEVLSSQKGYRAEMATPFIQKVIESAKVVYETKYQSPVLVRPSNAGTGPMSLFDQYIGLSIATAGAGWAHSRAHAPNESMRMEDYYQAIEHMIVLMEKMSS